jgi:hypothetical protein
MGTHTLTGLILASVLAALAGCSEGDLGAVSVRWRIVDLQTSIGYDPKSLPDVGNGSCPGPGWVVDNVRIQVKDPITGAPVPVQMKFVIFTCRQREATTSFNIPLGRFAFDLCAFSSDPQICDEGVTPAPLIRTVKQAEIINLDVIEIGVRPRNPPPILPDLSVGDALGPF